MHTTVALGAAMDAGMHTGVPHATAAPLPAVPLVAVAVALKLPGRGLAKLKLPVVLMGTVGRGALVTV